MMNRELLRDTIVNGLENSSESKTLKRIIWAGMAFAALYFAPVAVRILAGS